MTAIEHSTGILPSVSIIVPSFNTGRYIEQTLLSILNQDCPRAETIVVDGGSTDDTLPILRRYQDRLRWISEKDRGQSDAINKGFRMSRGEIVAWLNADDLYEPGAIRTAAEHLAAHPETGMVYGQVYNVTEDNEILERYYSEPFDIGRLTEALIIHQPATFYRREVFQAAGLLDESLHYTMDLDLWIRIAQHYRIDYIEKHMARFRIHGGSKTQAQRLLAQKQVLDVISRHLGSAPLFFEQDYARCRLSPVIPSFLYGLFTDGGAFRRVRLGPFPETLGKLQQILILGEVRVQDLPLQLEFLSAGRSISRISITQGPRFEACFDVPPESSGAICEIIADKQHVPRDETPGAWDGRRLSYRIIKMTLIGSKKRQICWDLVTPRLTSLVIPLLAAGVARHYNKRIPWRWLLGEYRRLLRRIPAIAAPRPQV